MKKLWPTDNKPNTAISGNDPNSKPITEQQYIDLVNKVNQAECDVEQVQDALDTHIANQATSVTTADLTATNVNACHLTGTTTNTCSLNADTATIGTATIDTITSDNITVDCKVIANEVDATSASITNANLTCATIDNLSTSNFSPLCICSCSVQTNVVNAQWVCSTNSDLTCVCSEDVDTCMLWAQCSCITNADIAKAYLHEIDCTNNAKIACIDNKYITHKHTPQHISELEEFWIVLPKFTNGEYFLEARNDTDAKLWSMEVDNSQANIRFKWSNNVRAYIKDVEIVPDVDTEFLQIHIETFGEEVTLYSQSISLENTLPPSIYGSKQYDTGKDFDITALAGTYMPNAIFAGDFHAESIEFDETVIDCIGIGCQLRLPTEKDAYGDNINWFEGNDNAYITNVTDEYNHKYAKWVDPACTVERDNTKLITSDAVSCYDGKVCVGTDAQGDPIYEYPIKELNCNTTVHGTLTAESVITECLNSCNIYDTGNDLKLTNPKRESDNCPYIAAGTLCDDKPVVYNETDNLFETTDTLNIDALTVNTLNADKAFIKELDTVKEETISSTGNYIALRANNASAMSSGETAGILVNNYNGNGKMSAVVADNYGIVRVGTGTPTNTTYPTLYFKKSDSKYYTDIADPTTEVTPAGALTRWDDVEDTEDYTKWTNAVFSVVDFSKTTTTNYVKIGAIYYDYNIVEATPTGTETEGHIIDAVYGIADYDEYTTGVVKSYNDKVYVLLTKSNADRTVVEVTGVDGDDFVGTVTLDDDLYEEIYDNGTTLLDNGPFNLGTLTSFSVTESTLEPLTTRADAVDMADQGLTKWNNTGKKIDTIATPTASEQILTANVEAGSTTTTAVWTNGTLFFDENANVISRPAGAAGTPHPLMTNDIVLYNGTAYHYDSGYENWCPVTDLTYDYVNYDSDHPVTDPDIIDALNESPTIYLEYVVYTNTTQGSVSYQWANKPSGVYHFASIACYEAYTGNIPENSIVVIDDENNHLMGDNQ